MIVLLRYIKDGQGYALRQFDLEKFSEEQVRSRLSEIGIGEDEVYVSDIVDWGLSRIMSLSEVYRLRAYISELYDGDSYLVKFLLKSGVSFDQIFSNYYVYFGKNDLELMVKLLGHGNPEELIRSFNKAFRWDSFVMNYVNAGYIVSTPKGFYVTSDFLI